MTFLTDARGIQLNDQASLQFAQSNLTYVEPGIYERPYPEKEYGRHVPVVTEGSAYAATATWYTMDWAGEAKFFGPASADTPYVEVSMDQKNSPNYQIVAGFRWSVLELNQALLAGVNMSNEKPMKTRTAIVNKLYDIAITGAAEKGASFTGLINDPAVTAADVAATGAGSSKFWTAKTPDQIISDVNTLLRGVATATNNEIYANALRLPPTAFDYLATTRLGAGDGDKTILDFVRAKNIWTSRTRQELDIDVIPELETASASGDGRMIAYRKDREYLDFWLPMPYLLSGLKEDGIWGYKGGAMASTGGTRIKMPAAVRYADQITDA